MYQFPSRLEEPDRSSEIMFSKLLADVQTLRDSVDNLETRILRMASGSSENSASSNLFEVNRPYPSNQHEHPEKKLENERELKTTQRKSCKKVFESTSTSKKAPNMEIKKKRQFQDMSNALVLHGFRDAAAAVHTAERIAAERKVRNTPIAFRSRRKSLSEQVCEKCRDAFREEASGARNPDVSYQPLLRRGCNHKELKARPPTPKRYWDIDFEDTPTQSPVARDQWE